MMEIYFDDILINEDYYTALSTNFTLFGDTFYLGSTAFNTYNISIAKEAVTEHPNTVLIKSNGELVATLVVDKIEENDFEYKYTLTDKMVNLEFKYDASLIFNNGSATLLEIAQDICNKAGIELSTMDFRGYNKEISWYDNTRTAREYIGYIAELNGGYAQIGKDGRLYFVKQNTPSVKTISIDDCEDFKIGERHIITRGIYEQGALKYEYGDETGNTLYLSGDNVYITEQSEVEEIFNEINGFEFYSFSTNNCPIDYNIMAGQVITFTDGVNNYPTIAGYDLTYNGDWYGGYNLDVATKKQEETQAIGTSDKIRDLSIKVDRANNKITEAANEIDEQSSKLTQVEQTVDSISQKVENIEDVTNTVEGTRIITLENCVEGDLLELHIYGNNTVFDYLYPSDDLYPSDTLYPYGDSRIIINNATHGSEEIISSEQYELGITEVLRQNEEVCDEYILENGQAKIIRRVNADGTTKVNEVIEDLGEFKIPLKEGDNYIEIKNYTAKLKAKFAIKNTYTDRFATKVEMSSKFELESERVNIELSKKTDTDHIISSINMSTEKENDGSRMQLRADLISLVGKILKLSEGMSIVSKNFNVDSLGHVTIGGNEDDPALVIKDNDGNEIEIIPNYIFVQFSDGRWATMQKGGFGAGQNVNGSSYGTININGDVDNPSITVWKPNSGSTYIYGTGITTPVLTQTSLAENKKNFEKLENALEIIKQVDIYKYNLKDEKDTDKKHLGFVIGYGYNYSKDLTSNNNDGADIYSLASCCLAGLKEAMQQIENMQKEIEKLKGGQANG